MKTMREAAQAALDVQNAVNLSGVLHSWANAQQVLREACGGNASGDYLRHPVNVLFLSKVTSLMAVATDCIGGVYMSAKTFIEGYDEDLFLKAFTWCQENSRN